MSIGRIDHNREIARDLDRCIAKKTEMAATIAEQAATIERFREFVHQMDMRAFDEVCFDANATVYRRVRDAITPADMGERDESGWNAPVSACNHPTIERFRAFVRAFDAAEGFTSQTMEWFGKRNLRNEARAKLTPADMGEVE